MTRRRPSNALVLAIHAAALEEIADAQDRHGTAVDRRRIKALLAAATTANRCLRELERITGMIGLAHGRDRLQGLLADVRHSLLDSDTGWLVVDKLEPRAANRPAARGRRYRRVRELLAQAELEGLRTTPTIKQIAHQWARDFWVLRRALSQSELQRLLGIRKRRLQDPTKSDDLAALLREQLRKLLERPPRAGQN